MTEVSAVVVNPPKPSTSERMAFLAARLMSLTGLVLCRKETESIYIDGPCRVTVARISGDRVRLRIVADRETPIDRDEIVRDRIAKLRRAG